MTQRFTDDAEIAGIAAQCQRLISSQKTVSLSTLSTAGYPEISYAPYLREENGNFYIFVSELAHHTRNLMQNPVASILFAAPESETRNLFARERAFFNCSVTELARDTDRCDALLDKMQDSFGNTLELLRKLPDFHLFELKPEKGQYTVGFGKAFSIQADGSFEHIVVN